MLAFKKLSIDASCSGGSGDVEDGPARLGTQLDVSHELCVPCQLWYYPFGPVPVPIEPIIDYFTFFSLNPGTD